MLFRWKWITAHYWGSLQCSHAVMLHLSPQFPSNPSNNLAADCKAKLSIWWWQLLIWQLYFGPGFQLWCHTGERTFIPHSWRAKGAGGLSRTAAAAPPSGRAPTDERMNDAVTVTRSDQVSCGWIKAIIHVTEQRCRGCALQTYQEISNEKYFQTATMNKYICGSAYVNKKESNAFWWLWLSPK